MKDLQVNDTGGLVFENGDFKISESANQHQKSILLGCKGDFKEFPELGVGIEQLIADDQYNEVLIEAKKNLEYDGMLINNISINENGILKIDGKYKNN